jgi:hypothetical protein
MIISIKPKLAGVLIKEAELRRKSGLGYWVSQRKAKEIRATRRARVSRSQKGGYEKGKKKERKGRKRRERALAPPKEEKTCRKPRRWG